MSADGHLDLTTRLDIRPVAGRVGAEIAGLTLSADLPDADIGAIEAALYRHKVLFFHGQQHLDDDAHEAFAARLGELLPHPTVPVRKGSKSLLELDSIHGGGRANAWHTDITFLPAYPKASILRAVQSTQSGGDTVWANTAEAYKRLPEALRALADSAWAIHTNAYDYAAAKPNARPEDVARHREVFASTVYETEHPVVRVHPETGERTLVLGQFLKSLKGFDMADSRRIYETLQAHVTQLENTVRWRWAEGDVAIWDNRATQHYAINDYGDQRRIMRRVTLAGDVPLSIDGRSSRAISPAPAN
ncbi:TauD/TfdA family dioxygenase [Phenylobacterium sp.]|uniref:TauD/TfdA dioxygenase family protein n=1 Tax=Phenylobacterium sp. TaxID=1871053 RepID=UPI001206F157|nr:TauD/TfdA family dioxygenase [Phenylobacterium sp.]THD61582.1 MAG: TauD/TfdA family dioxygenase [Phenylobacterium sp.]